MTNAKPKGIRLKPAIETLRGLVNWCSYWNETWNQQWSIEGLTALYAFAMSEQGGQIDETADRWPEWLILAIFKYGTLPPKLYERAKKINF